MAPEFFPFLAFFFLAVIAVICIIISVMLFVWWRYQKKHRVARILSVLAFSGTLIVVLLLLFIGLNIRQQFFLNEPLVSACAEGNLSESQRLLARGASPDAYGVDFMQTALISATRSGHLEIVELLLRNGADINLQDCYGRTALDYAKEAGQSEIAIALEQADRLP
jgi:ankyrin repeat protein